MYIFKYRTEDIDIEKTVSEFEEKYNLTLPDSYRLFLIRYNGGDTPDTEFRINREDSDVRAFYGIGNVTYSFDKIHDLELLLKKGYLPIANDSFGNYIAIGISTDETGQIFFLDHEKQYRAKKLTDTFKMFIQKCKTNKNIELRTRSIEERERTMIEAGTEAFITDALRKEWAEEIEKYSGKALEHVVVK